MANFFTQTETTQSWILSKYSRYNFKDKLWTDLDSAKCISPIKLSITPSCHLVISYQTTIYECINLWNSRDTHNGIFKGNSFLILHKSKESVCKFRVKFLTYENKTAEEHCTKCVQILSNFFKIDDHQDNNNLIQLDNSIIVNDSSSFYSKISFEQSNSATIATAKDMAKVLIKQNDDKLPSLIDNDSNLFKDNDDYLKEFIMCNLLDTTFPQFVNKIEDLLNDLIHAEINASSSSSHFSSNNS